MLKLRVEPREPSRYWSTTVAPAFDGSSGGETETWRAYCVTDQNRNVGKG